MHIISRVARLHISSPPSNIKETFCTGPTVFALVVLTLILINSQCLRPEDTVGESWNDECNMTACRDHWISSVSTALDWRVFMCVYVGDYLKACLAADGPKWPIARAVENDDAGIQGMRVEV